MIQFFLALFFPVFCLAGNSESFKGFVKISQDRELYVNWKYAQAGKPTVVLLNGMTYSTKQWDRFTSALTKYGIGVLRYDPMGMGETLLKYAPVREDIQIVDQAKDLHLLLGALKINGPANFAGLSYGGGLALIFAKMYPQQVGNLFLMAPYTEPLASQDQWIKAQIWYTRQIQPWNPSTDDQLYAFFYRQIVYSTYPMAEPIVMQNPYALESVYRLGLGIRKFSAVDVVKSLPERSVHLIIAGKDQYIPREVLTRFWNDVPETSKASRIVITNSEHKIPESFPRFSAAWIAEILSGSRETHQGFDFDGDPYSGVVKYKNGKFQLVKEF